MHIQISSVTPSHHVTSVSQHKPHHLVGMVAHQVIFHFQKCFASSSFQTQTTCLITVCEMLQSAQVFTSHESYVSTLIISGEQGTPTLPHRWSHKLATKWVCEGGISEANTSKSVVRVCLSINIWYLLSSVSLSALLIVVSSSEPKCPRGQS